MDAEILSLIDERLRPVVERLDRLAGIEANLILLLKRAHAGDANARLQLQAAINSIREEVTELRSLLVRPEVLAAIAPQDVIDRARQIKRRGLMAVVGEEKPVKIPVHTREDEITLIGFPLGSGKSWSLRANRSLVKAICVAAGAIAGMIAHRYGVPLPW